jgi:hypothetical protein
LPGGGHIERLSSGLEALSLSTNIRQQKNARVQLLSLGMLIIIGYGPAPVAAQDALLGVDVSTAVCGPSTLITIDTATGAGTAIGPITGFPCVSGLAFAPDGTLYGVSDPAFGGTGDLIRIDPITGSATAVGLLGFPR